MESIRVKIEITTKKEATKLESLQAHGKFISLAKMPIFLIQIFFVVHPYSLYFIWKSTLVLHEGKQISACPTWGHMFESHEGYDARIRTRREHATCIIN